MNVVSYILVIYLIKCAFSLIFSPFSDPFEFLSLCLLEIFFQYLLDNLLYHDQELGSDVTEDRAVRGKGMVGNPQIPPCLCEWENCLSPTEILLPHQSPIKDGKWISPDLRTPGEEWDYSKWWKESKLYFLTCSECIWLGLNHSIQEIRKLLSGATKPSHRKDLHSLTAESAQ